MPKVCNINCRITTTENGNNEVSSECSFIYLLTILIEYSEDSRN